MKRVEFSRRLIVPKKYKSASVRAKLSNNVVNHLGEGQHRDGDGHICTVARARTILSHSQAAVIMRTEGMGTCIL